MVLVLCGMAWLAWLAWCWSAWSCTWLWSGRCRCQQVLSGLVWC
ncbi:hypothetical protein I3843_05G142100 [Carya illinoinensis]|nr:hypothetical protein I3843_05G142100 [Carya illinoinensis]